MNVLSVKRCCKVWKSGGGGGGLSNKAVLNITGNYLDDYVLTVGKQKKTILTLVRISSTQDQNTLKNGFYSKYLGS